MNKMKEVAKLLGVELGEKFNIRLKDGNLSRYNPYYITEDGVFDKFGDESFDYMAWLLLGRVTIEKIPFRPVLNEVYYSIIFDKTTGVHFFKTEWTNHSFDYMRYALGNCFKTEEEITEEIKEEMVKKLKGAYENGKA